MIWPAAVQRAIVRPETAAWVRQAEADLQTGEIVLAASVWYAASWFAQQAAEKALKALYLERLGGEPPRTHDLLALGERLTVPAEIDGILETL